MQHEKIIKRGDGSAVLITVSLGVGSYERNVYWSVVISVKAPKKRKFISVDYADWKYRQLGAMDRKKYALSKQLEVVTPEEILAAKLELWEQLKPV